MVAVIQYFIVELVAVPEGTDLSGCLRCTRGGSCKAIHKVDTSNVINFGIFLATVIAAFIAWLGTIRARNSADEANRIQAELLKLEEERDKRNQFAEQKAFFHVETEHHIRKEYLRLHLKNVGNGTAHKVQFFVNKKDITHWPSFRKSDLVMDPTFKPGAAGVFEFSADFEELRPTFMFIKWTDDLDRLQTQPVEL